MKIYTPALPVILLRIRIMQVGDFKNAKYFSIYDCTQNEALEEFKTLIANHKVSPFFTGKRTNIEIREAVGGTNGKAKSISFKGLTVDETYNLIVQYINDQQK